MAYTYELHAGDLHTGCMHNGILIVYRYVIVMCWENVVQSDHVSLATCDYLCNHSIIVSQSTLR